MYVMRDNRGLLYEVHKNITGRCAEQTRHAAGLESAHDWSVNADQGLHHPTLPPYNSSRSIQTSPQLPKSGFHSILLLHRRAPSPHLQAAQPVSAASQQLPSTSFHLQATWSMLSHPRPQTMPTGSLTMPVPCA
jgi:hypothetical protein